MLNLHMSLTFYPGMAGRLPAPMVTYRSNDKMKEHTQAMCKIRTVQHDIVR